MPWAKLDDRFWKNAKIRAASNDGLAELLEDLKDEPEIVKRAIRACYGVGNIPIPPLSEDPIARELGIVPDEPKATEHSADGQESHEPRRTD